MQTIAGIVSDGGGAFVEGLNKNRKNKMEKYKFRGKSIQTGEWVYGYGVVFSPENDIYQIIWDTSKPKDFGDTK